MQIGCTKKLLRALHITVSDATEDNDLFCWSADLITYKEKNAVVVVNDSNRFGFVLYDLQADDLKGLKALIQAGIRRCLQHEGIREDIIDAYFGQSPEWVLTKTRGRVFTARLNKACKGARFFDDRFDTSELYQTEVTGTMNSQQIETGIVGKHIYPYELLIRDFKGLLGEKIIASDAYDLLISLDLGRSRATRRLLVPTDVTFKELHEIILTVFGWLDWKWHSFKLFDRRGRCIVTIISEFEKLSERRQVCPILRDKDVRFDAYIKKAKTIIYTYDYSDDWTHDITVLGIVSDYDKNYPTCIMAAGNHPPEGVGGIAGYEAFLKILKNPDHPEYQTMKNFNEAPWYWDFDMEEVNRRLRHVLGR